MGAPAHTLWRIEIPPGRFYPNHSGATPIGCARVHPLASQITPRAILSESPGGSGATPIGCARAHHLASQITPWAILSESPGGSGATPIGCAHAHPLASQTTPGRFYPNHPGARGLLSGTKYWGTQRGGANNHQTLMLPNRQEHNYTSCTNDRRLAPPHPTPEGWLCLT